jgi:hypothetical protein
MGRTVLSGTVRAWIVGLMIIGVVCAAAASARAAAPLTRGFADDVWFDGIGPHWIPLTVSTGAKVALLEIDWLSVEPHAPTAGQVPTSPSDPAYNFGYVDSVVKEFAGTGISPAFLVTDAPSWAEAPGGPASLEADGAWKPNAAALGQFATALARRYSGSFPDPAKPKVKLPRVRYYQAWAEANINIHLSPQWTRVNGHYVAASPGIYRGLLNAFYAGIKKANRSDVVIASGLGPFGDPPGPCVSQQAGNGCRIPPAQFMRGLLCQDTALHKLPCPTPATFDAIAIDPYEVSAPTTAAANRDDVSAPDLGKLTRIVNAAVSAGTALPRAHKQLWVTEFSYDSNPPNPTAVSLATQARWLEQSFYIFWSEGVNAVMWYLMRDQTAKFKPVDYYSGIYTFSGRKKPSFEAYRFPLVVSPLNGSARVWGIAPRTGTVTVELRQGRSWRTLFHLRVRAGAVFVHGYQAQHGQSFRAVIGPEASLVWNY